MEMCLASHSENLYCRERRTGNRLLRRLGGLVCWRWLWICALVDKQLLTPTPVVRAAVNQFIG